MRSILALSKNCWKEVYRKKDIYVLFVLLVIFLMVLLNENFFNVSGVSRFLKDIGFSLLWLFSLIVGVTFSARQIPVEISSHTIQPLLAKPLSRFQMILGKFTGSALAAVFSFTLFYVFFSLISQLKGEGIGEVLFFQAYFLGVLFLCLVCAMSIFLSTFLTVSGNVTVSLLIYIFMSWFGENIRIQILSPQTFIAFSSNLVYQFLPHYEFYDLRMRIVHGWEPLPFWVVSVILIYTVIYVAFLLMLSYLKIRKKSL